MASLPYSLEALLLGTKRDVSGNVNGEAISIIPDVIVSEYHADEVQVTSHPVGVGANIADHAYVMPGTLVCKFGWSHSSLLINSAMSGSILKGLRTINDVYEKLLEVMRARQPLSVGTGKRKYQNMIITRLETTTTADTESALLIDVTFQEVLRAQTKSVAMVSNPVKHGGLTNGGLRVPKIGYLL